MLVVAEQGQPLPSIVERGPIIVLLEGKLHDRAALERAAGANGGDPQADGGLVLDAYAALGKDALLRISGVFAVIIWDGRKGRAICVRDRLGTYPVYHAHAAGNTFVSPAVELLLAQQGITAEPNRLSLAGFIVDLAPRPEETFFADLKRIPPGHSLELGATRARAARYWHLEGHPGQPAADAEEALSRFDRLLHQAVRRSLEFGPSGIWLSGGVDSAAVAVAAASEISKGGSLAPWALSLVFPDPSCNEEDLQRTLAASLGLPQLIGPLKDFAPAEGLLLASLDLSRQSYAPPQSVWQVAYDGLALAAKEIGCRVVLGGDGGDEWLQPPPLYAADRLSKLDLGGLNRLRRGWEEYYPISRRESVRSALWLYGARPLLRATAATVMQDLRPSAVQSYRRRRLETWLPRWLAPDPELRAQLVDRALEEAGTTRPRSLYERAREARRAHPWLLYSMESAFERSRRLGVRILNPLLDVDLLAFLDQTAPELVNYGGRAKGLPREVTLRAVPAPAPNWPKKVHAEAFWLATMRREGHLGLHEFGALRALQALGVVHSGTYAREAEQAFAQATKAGSRLWEALSLEAWLSSG